jgi:tetratricopeptide (TPR) repeat protein
MATPTSVQDLRAEARRLAAVGRLDEAMTALKRQLEADPGDAALHSDLGGLASTRGDQETARVHYETAVRIAPANAAYRKTLADFTLVVLGQPDEAVELYRAVLEIAPNDAETLLILGHLSVSHQRFEEAAQYYRRALAADPGNATAAEVLALMQSKGIGGVH